MFSAVALQFLEYEILKHKIVEIASLFSINMGYATANTNTLEMSAFMSLASGRKCRLPGFLSSCPHWVPPSPQQQTSVAPPLPHWVQGRRHTRLRGGGVGGPNSDEGTDTLVLCVYCNPATPHVQRIQQLDEGCFDNYLILDERQQSIPLIIDLGSSP
jgi:hypothetical protein